MHIHFLKYVLPLSTPMSINFYLAAALQGLRVTITIPNQKMRFCSKRKKKHAEILYEFKALVFFFKSLFTYQCGKATLTFFGQR